MNDGTALIVGASGFVGQLLLHKFRTAFRDVAGTYFQHPVEGLDQLDYRDGDAVRRLIGRRKPAVVVCPAAQPNVDWCEDHPVESYDFNVRGPSVLAEAAAERGIPLVFFSSDYVFDGRTGPYDEDAPTNPINVYGAHKTEAEKVIQSLLPDTHMIVRTTVAYGWERQGRNFVYRLVHALRAGKSTRVPVDQVGTPTYGPNLADAVLSLVEGEYYGTWNIAGPALMSRFSFGKVVADVFGLVPQLIEGVETAELGQRADRPLHAGLRTEKLRGSLNSELWHPRRGLEHMRDTEQQFVWKGAVDE